MGKQQSRMVNMARPLLFHELYDIYNIGFSSYKLKGLFIKSMHLLEEIRVMKMY